MDMSLIFRNFALWKVLVSNLNARSVAKLMLMRSHILLIGTNALEFIIHHVQKRNIIGNVHIVDVSQSFLNLQKIRLYIRSRSSLLTLPVRCEWRLTRAFISSFV